MEEQWWTWPVAYAAAGLSGIYILGGMWGYRKNVEAANKILPVLHRELAKQWTEMGADASARANSLGMGEFALRVRGRPGAHGAEVRLTTTARHDLVTQLRGLLGPVYASGHELVLEAALERNQLGGEFALLPEAEVAAMAEDKDRDIWYRTMTSAPAHVRGAGLNVLAEHPSIMDAVLGAGVHTFLKKTDGALREVVVTAHSPYPKYPNIARVTVRIPEHADEATRQTILAAACDLLHGLVDLSRGFSLSASAISERQRGYDLTHPDEVAKKKKLMEKEKQESASSSSKKNAKKKLH